MKHTWVYYADDLVLMASTRNELRRKLVEWRASLLVKGLKVNARKIKPTVGGGGGGLVSEVVGNDCRAGVKDGKDRDEDDQVDVWCFPDRKTAQHWTEKTSRWRGNWGCDEKMQTEMAWTCRKKGWYWLCDYRSVVEGRHLSAGRGRPGLPTCAC